MVHGWYFRILIAIFFLPILIIFSFIYLFFFKKKTVSSNKDSR